MKEQLLKKNRVHALLERIPEDKIYKGAEIGVWRGSTSSNLLKKRPLLSIIGVDRYCPPPPGDSYFQGSLKIANYDQPEFDAAKAKALENVGKCIDRFELMEMTSVEAAELVQDTSLNFVFIDGDHSYEGCMLDIMAWMRKVKPGGWIGGHDYYHPEQGDVKKAVDEYFSAIAVQLSYQKTWFVEA